MKRKKLRFAWSCSDYAHHEHRYRLIAMICSKIQWSLHQMGLGKRIGLYLLCASFLLGGCASSSELTKAFQVVNAVSAVRNGLQSVYPKVIEAHPDLVDEIEAFDKDFYNWLQSTYEVLILVQKGDASIADYRAKVSAVVGLLERHNVVRLVPELREPLILVQKLLGIFHSFDVSESLPTELECHEGEA